jgi:hypothetical protein
VISTGVVSSWNTSNFISGQSGNSRYSGSSKHTPALFGQSLKMAVVSEPVSGVDIFAIEVQVESTEVYMVEGGGVCSLLKHDGYQTMLGLAIAGSWKNSPSRRERPSMCSDQR